MLNSNKNSFQWDPRSVTAVYIAERTTHTSLTPTKAGGEKVEQPRVSNLLHFYPAWACRLENIFLFLHLYIYSCLSPTIHSPTTSLLFFLSFFLSSPGFFFLVCPGLQQAAVMTHLPVKLLAVETARPWHGTQSLSASLLKALKNQADIIPTASGITTTYAASIVSRGIRLKQSDTRGRTRHDKDCAKIWE